MSFVGITCRVVEDYFIAFQFALSCAFATGAVEVIQQLQKSEVVAFQVFDEQMYIVLFTRNFDHVLKEFLHSGSYYQPFPELLQ